MGRAWNLCFTYFSITAVDDVWQVAGTDECFTSQLTHWPQPTGTEASRQSQKSVTTSPPYNAPLKSTSAPAHAHFHTARLNVPSHSGAIFSARCRRRRSGRADQMPYLDNGMETETEIGSGLAYCEDEAFTFLLQKRTSDALAKTNEEEEKTTTAPNRGKNKK